MRMTIMLDDVMSWSPCWDDESLMAYAGGRTEEATLTLLMDKRLKITERIWLACWAMDDRERRMFACACASRALDREEASGRVVDPRSREAVRVARRYADGRATSEELRSARDASMSASWSASCETATSAAMHSAMSAACEAVYNASWSVAGNTSCDAAYNAACMTELQTQLEWILSEYLGDSI